MDRKRVHLSAALILNTAVFVCFAVAALAMVAIVRRENRREAIREALERAQLILDRNLATHTYFSHRLKPAVFPLSGAVRPPGYFDPTWMSSIFAVREIDKAFRFLHPGDYYYKECAINARCPENEADPVERAFIERLNREPKLQVESTEREIGGKRYYVVLRRGETMEQACLRCHDTPERAPAELVARYGTERSFRRSPGEVVSAISIRVPLAAAYASADRITLQVAAALGSGLLLILTVQLLLNRRFILGPLARVAAKAGELSSDESKLGETIELPVARELADLAAAFNRMSRDLRSGRDHLEQTVAKRTTELRAANADLQQALADVKTLRGLIPICAHCKKIRDDGGYWQQIEAYIAAHSDASFSHGICPQCMREFYPEILQQIEQRGGSAPGGAPPRAETDPAG